MAPYESGTDTEAADRAAAARGRKKAARYAVPVVVLGLAAATIGLVPALADSGDPDLPELSAQELIEKIAASDTKQLSGTVKISTDLGLPDLGGLAGGMASPRGEQGEGGAADPKSRLTELASGTHTLRVAADGPDRQRLSILDDAAEYSLIHNGDEVWAYDSASDEAFHATEDGKHGDGGRSGHRGGLPKDVPATPGEFAEEVLKASADTTSVTAEGTMQVAGRDAYKLVVKPKGEGSTVGAVTFAVDAKTGTPLKATLTPAGGGAAVVEAGYTKVDFGKPAASLFDYRPAKGTKVTEAEDAGKEARGKGVPRGPGKQPGAGDVAAPEILGEGWSSIARFEVPGGQGLPDAGSGDLPPEAASLLDAFGDKVKGDFGTGRVFSTRLVNALITDDGTVYAGAVTKDALVKAAESAK
ncbi:hypothetical protein SLNWT_4503 [Streptomyces albus]|uniref:DUF2092 domain-containing protein n=1 Tax=Streptomyces albus (strain ATCC 21838 / DSM 41398 / FERM P-419 / JCM 4703 / NBRC 107858) TaxID=1081613 RepID=A0A0B5ET79_STRA4|nr:hypothetical protein SLNWT_4503 [Streptomyces albus]AOU79186.1 hypothetical protein SLNHY_4495 [Streptomyces albus]AYN34919.1 hypothetical protein DUI70_4420 [Streptomyces albus]